MTIRSLIALITITAAVLLFVAVSSGASSTLTSGAKQWSVRYDGPGNGPDYGTGIRASADGTKVFVTNQSYGGATTGDDYATIAYNVATGQKSWAHRYNGLGSGYDAPHGLAVSPDGTRVFVTGESYGSSTSKTAYATVAYDASTGAELWAKRYNGPVDGFDRAEAVAVSTDGTKVFVTGKSYGGVSTGNDYATIAYDASTGAQLWAKRYNGPGNGADWGWALGVSADGTRVFVTGSVYAGSTTGDDYATVAYGAATGALLWAKRYTGPGNGGDTARSLTVSPSGTKVLVTGYSDGTSTTLTDFATVAYNASTGSKLWAARYDGAASKDDYAFVIAVSPDGTKAFVAGSTADATNEDDYATVAYDTSSGTKLWSTRYNGPGNGYDGAFAIGVNPAGTKVFVTGESYGGPLSGDDGATVAYNPSTGSKLWAARYTRTSNGNDGFYGLDVGADGTKVFLSGDSEGDATSGYDAVTAAYEG